MNIKELEMQLKQNKIPESRYNTTGKGMDDNKYNIIENNGKWSVYYGERGRRYGERIFNNESAACKYMYNKLVGKNTKCVGMVWGIICVAICVVFIIVMTNA